MSFEGKSAVITGASRGIGRAIAEVLAERGADVVIGDIDDTQAKLTAEEIAANTGRRAISVDLDVVELASCQHAIDKAVELLKAAGAIGGMVDIGGDNPFYPIQNMHNMRTF